MADEAPIKIFLDYFVYVAVFSLDPAMKLPKHTSINNHVIELEEQKQLPYDLIYNLGLVELEILETYIRIHLKTGFIGASKSPAEVLIFFAQKEDRSLRLYVDYRELNNQTIKN